MRVLQTGLTILITTAFLFSSPGVALANEGDGGHAMEVEVNGYHVTLDNQNEWVMGENTLVVTIIDSMGMHLSDVDVEILITPKEDGHGSSETDAHDSG